MARIAFDQLASLGVSAIDDAPVDRQWTAETQRRAALLESGDACTIQWDEVQRRFAERRDQRRG